MAEEIWEIDPKDLEKETLDENKEIQDQREIKTNPQVWGIAVEPEKVNRFIVHLPGIEPFIVKSVSSIACTCSETPPYSREWEDITFTLYNMITPSILQALERFNHRIDRIVIDRTGPVGDKVGEIVLEDSYVKEIHYGIYDWSKDDLSTSSITVKPSRVTINY